MRFCFDQKDFVERDIHPDKLAVIGDDFELTWSEFSRETEKLCDFFESSDFHFVKHPVMIYGHKSAYMVVAIYAMMKMEIPYIPIDIIYPQDRIAKIADIAKTQLVINTTTKRLELPGVNEIMVSENDAKIVQVAAIEKRLEKAIDPVVYIIFTSGSTGEPKGVQVSSEAVQSFTRWMANDFGFLPGDVFINTALFSFDLSGFELMTFGAIGASILLNNKQANADPNILLQRIADFKGTVWVSTPSFMVTYSRLKDESRMDSVHTFLFCGEVLPNDIAQKLLTNYSKARVLNTYGPTEATVATTLVEITQAIIDAHNPLPVGRVKRESLLLIENNEIIIIGPNVSAGYVENDVLNKTKFSIIDGQRAFHTGDMGVIHDGMLFFIGRDDDLIKLHGYRIELNEINTALNALGYVEHAETLALKRNGSVKKIVAIAELSGDEIVDVAKIQDDLSRTLPPYMIPADIKFIDEIPLNQNGKVDKKLLTEIYLSR